MALNQFKNRILSVFLLLFPLLITLQAQVKVKDDKETDEVRKYAFYIARNGETAFSISRKFNLTLEDFYKFNLK